MSVHFGVPSSPVEEKKSTCSLLITDKDAKRPTITMGFLKQGFTYEMRIDLDIQYPEPTTFKINQALEHFIPRMSFTPDQEANQIIVELTAGANGSLYTSFDVILLSTDSNPISVTTCIVTAKILGKNKGTPALKSHVHCTCHDVEPDSDDETEWEKR